MHYVQGKTERVNDVLGILQEFYRDTLRLPVTQEGSFGAELLILGLRQRGL